MLSEDLTQPLHIFQHCVFVSVGPSTGGSTGSCLLLVAAQVCLTLQDQCLRYAHCTHR